MRAMPKPTVLVIDNQAQIRRLLRAGFQLAGFSVIEAKTGAEGLEFATLNSPDVIILEPVLPDMEGKEIIDTVRGWSDAVIIVVSERSEEREKVLALELGADDYVVKPFGMAELLARVHTIQRRYLQRPKGGEPVIRAGPLVIDLAHHAVSVRGVPVRVTPQEYRLLKILGQHAGKVVIHEHLMKEIWGPDYIELTHHLSMLVSKVRRKVEVDPGRPTIIMTELGIGYRLALPP